MGLTRGDDSVFLRVIYHARYDYAILLAVKNDSREAAMSTTQMNLRIDARVKERGDAALARVGYSPSQVVRTVWEFAAAHIHDSRAVKDFLGQAGMQQDSDKRSRVEAKMAALEGALALQVQLEESTGLRHSAEFLDVPDRQLRGEALFERWEERGLA